MQAEAYAPNDNHILARLPFEDYQRLLPHLEQVELRLSQVVQQAGSLIEHVYFPQSAMISLISYTPKGQSVEVGVVGFEGVTAISLILGVDESPHEGLVQFPGVAMRIKTQALRDEFDRAGALHKLLLRYTQGLLLQTSQIVVCNVLHTVPERLARWLLMTYDRCANEDLPFTQEFLSLMLGTRRAGVTEAAITLQAEGYINYRRGHIRITDQQRLRDYACDCYEVVKTEFDLLIA